MIRKLNKKELDLWKAVTKNDKKLKSYTLDYSYEGQKTSSKIIETENQNNLQEKIFEKDGSNYEGIKKNKTSYKNQKLQINKRMRAKLERGLIRPEAVLDLHGFNRIDAQDLLKSFISSCINQEKRCILIVTGKKRTISGAKSVLRELIPKWLAEEVYSSLILAHTYATKRDGGDGARYVLLRKKEIKI